MTPSEQHQNGAGEHHLTNHEQARMLKQIHNALVGDPLAADKPGLVQRVARHDHDLYNVETGIKSRVQVLWDWRIKTAAGIAVLVFLVELVARKLL